MRRRLLAFLVALTILGAWLSIAALLIDAVLISLSVYQFEGLMRPLLIALVVFALMAGAGSLVVRLEGSDRLRFPLLFGWERARPGRFRVLLAEVGRALMLR